MESSKGSNTISQGGNQNAGAGEAKAAGGGGATTASTEDKTMKAPGKDCTISRDSFEREPAGYFKDLRK